MKKYDVCFTVYLEDIEANSETEAGNIAHAHLDNLGLQNFLLQEITKNENK